MNLGIVSLLFLLAAIVCGFFFKINTGLISIALALVIGKIGGLADKEIIAGFSASLFIMLLGVTYLFSIAQENGTLELISRKVVSLAGKRTNLIPIIIFFLAAILAGIGPGTVPVMALMAVFTMALAAEMKINPIMMSSIGLLGAQAGGLTPIAPTGIIGNELAAAQGFTVTAPLMWGQFIGAGLFSLALYIGFKGYQIKAENPVKFSDLPKFKPKQIITIAGIIVMIFMVLVLEVNAGLASFLVAGVLMLFKVANEKKAIANVPWGTLILVTGVGVLTNVVTKLEGITLLANALATMMTTKTAAPIIGLTAGIMSWFSSTSGVVMPTLIPTVGSIIEAMGGGITAGELVTAITVTSHTAGISPISTGGALALAAYVSNAHTTAEEQDKLFVKMFAVAILGVVFMVAFAALGGFRLIK